MPELGSIHCHFFQKPTQSQKAGKEEDKEEDKDKSVRTRDADDFDAFWAVYPRKVGKGDAKKAFAKVKAPVSVLIAAVNTQKQSQQWLRNNGQYIPNPATWLNQGRWEDELPTNEATGRCCAQRKSQHRTVRCA